MREPFTHKGNATFEFGNGRVQKLPSYLVGAKRIFVLTGKHVGGHKK